MRWRLPIALVVVLVVAWAVTLLAVGRRSVDVPRPSRPGRVPANQKHYVTPRQLTSSGAMSGSALGPLTALAQDGKRRDWTELAAARPVVLVFIKEGCPCNVEFEPFFHRLYRAYEGSVRFVGVIDAGAESARQYTEANRVPYPVLADPERAIVNRFRAENGAYVALVTPDGVLDTLWPGCSAEMMRELSRRIAALADVEERPLDTTDLPTALTTGCPFAG